MTVAADRFDAALGGRRGHHGAAQLAAPGPLSPGGAAELARLRDLAAAGDLGPALLCLAAHRGEDRNDPWASRPGLAALVEAVCDVVHERLLADPEWDAACRQFLTLVGLRREHARTVLSLSGELHLWADGGAFEDSPGGEPQTIELACGLAHTPAPAVRPPYERPRAPRGAWQERLQAGRGYCPGCAEQAARFPESAEPAAWPVWETAQQRTRFARVCRDELPHDLIRGLGWMADPARDRVDADAENWLALNAVQGGLLAMACELGARPDGDRCLRSVLGSGNYDQWLTVAREHGHRHLGELLSVGDWHEAAHALLPHAPGAYEAGYDSHQEFLFGGLSMPLVKRVGSLQANA